MKVVKDFSSRVMHHTVICLILATCDQPCFLFAKGKSLLVQRNPPDKDFQPRPKFQEDLLPKLIKNSKLRTSSSCSHQPKIFQIDLVKLVNLYFFETILIPKVFTFLIDMEHVSLLNDAYEFYLLSLRRVVLKDILKYFKIQ